MLLCLAGNFWLGARHLILHYWNALTCCITLNIVGLCFGVHLWYLEIVWSFWGLILNFVLVMIQNISKAFLVLFSGHSLPPELYCIQYTMCSEVLLWLMGTWALEIVLTTPFQRLFLHILNSCFTCMHRSLLG